jgi:hypothetical protein
MRAIRELQPNTTPHYDQAEDVAPPVMNVIPPAGNVIPPAVNVIPPAVNVIPPVVDAPPIAGLDTIGIQGIRKQVAELGVAGKGLDELLQVSKSTSVSKPTPNYAFDPGSILTIKSGAKTVHITQLFLRRLKNGVFPAGAKWLCHRWITMVTRSLFSGRMPSRIQGYTNLSGVQLTVDSCTTCSLRGFSPVRISSTISLIPPRSTILLTSMSGTVF